MQDLFARYGVNTAAASSSNSMDPVPAGTYGFLMMDHNIKENGTGDLVANFKWAIIDGPHKGRFVFDYLTLGSNDPRNEKKAKFGQGRLRDIELALGLQPGQSSIEAFDRLKGNGKVSLTIDVRPAQTVNGKTYDAQNSVKKVLAFAVGSVQVMSPPPAPAFFPTQAQAPSAYPSAPPAGYPTQPGPLVAPAYAPATIGHFAPNGYAPAVTAVAPAVNAAPAGYTNVAPAPAQAAAPSPAVMAAAGPVPAFMQAMAPAEQAPPQQAWGAPAQ